MAGVDTYGAEAGRIAAERVASEQKLGRLRTLFAEGDQIKEDYHTEQVPIEGALALLVPPAVLVKIERATTLVANVWERGSVEERRELADRFFNAIRINLDKRDALYCILKEDLRLLQPSLGGCTWVTDGGRTHNPWIHNPVLHH